MNNKLIELATPLFQVILQLRSEMLSPSQELRTKLEELIAEFESKSLKLNYRDQQVADAKFAIAAFIDETVLTGKSSYRQDWELFPLQFKYFREALAGTTFYDRLDTLMKSSGTHADAIEIYYLCILLGFKGKYSVFLEDQLPLVIKQIADTLRTVGRLQITILSPHGLLNDQPPPPLSEPGLPLWLKVLGAVVPSILILAWLFMRLSLISNVNGVNETLLK